VRLEGFPQLAKNRCLFLTGMAVYIKKLDEDYFKGEILQPD
jgi:hypothetical protein